MVGIMGLQHSGHQILVRTDMHCQTYICMLLLHIAGLGLFPLHGTCHGIWYTECRTISSIWTRTNTWLADAFTLYMCHVIALHLEQLAEICTVPRNRLSAVSTTNTNLSYHQMICWLVELTTVISSRASLWVAIHSNSRICNFSSSSNPSWIN